MPLGLHWSLRVRISLRERGKFHQFLVAGLHTAEIATIPTRELTAVQNSRRVDWARRLLDSDSERLLVSNARLICEQIPELKSELIRRVMPLTLPSLQAAAAEFVSQVRTCLDGFPEEFSSLLDENFHEATGDYRDAALLTLLPILNQYKAVQNASMPELLEELRTRLSHIRQSALNSILKITR